MTKYTIADEIISIPTEVENEHYVQSYTTRLINKVGNIFDSWYSSQYDCASVYKNAN